MCDEQHGVLFLLIDLLEKLHDLVLDRDVQRCRRLVADDQIGVQDDRHCNHHALSHTAGQLMGIAVIYLLYIAQTDGVEGLEHLRSDLLFGIVRVQLQHLADLSSDTLRRVQ